MNYEIMAKMEIIEKVIPIKIKRILPLGNKYELWSISEL